MDYSTFQNMTSSEKIVLAIVKAASRLVGFSLYSGSIYSIGNFDCPVVDSLKSNDSLLTEVDSLGEVAAGSFYNDRTNKVLYLWLESDQNPNNNFINYVRPYFFSNKGVSLPYDLNTGEEVFFEPLIKSTSAFGVELDVVNESTSAIEGGGTITFHNDYNFWQQSFDKVFFENQICTIYSWNKDLKASEAKLIFRGYVDSKSYNSTEISLNLKDLLYNIRATVNLKNISELGLRNDPKLDSAKQRLVYGRVEGHRPVNVDSLIDNSYPLTGTISAFNLSNTIVGVGTQFKAELVPNDKILILGIQYTVSTIESDTALTLTSRYSGTSEGGLSFEVVPSVNKSFINRRWVLAGHPLNEPEFEIQHGSSVNRLVLNTTQDLYAGDDLWIGEYPSSGELVTINKVINATTVSLSQSTEIIYPADTKVTRICVQDVRMNDLKLIFGEDYEVDATSAQLVIKETAEENRAQVLESLERVTVETGDDFLTGSGTHFTSYIKPGYKVRPQDTSEWYTVSKVEDEKIYLNASYAGDSFTSAEPLPEITSITGFESYKEAYQLRVENGTDLQGKYFKIFDSNGSVAIWFDVGNIGTPEPDHGCDRALEVTTVEASDNYIRVGQKIKQRLDLDTEKAFTTTILGDVLTITNNSIGVRPVAKNANEDDIQVLSVNRNTQRVTCVADVADSLDGTYFVLHDSVGTVAFWIDTDNSGTPEPNHGCDRSVEITTIVTDDSLSTVRTKVKAFIEADSAFTTDNFKSDSIHVTCTMVGPSIGTMPINYSLSRSNDGKGLYDLHNTHFKLPYYDSPSCGTVGFYFDLDNQGISAPTTGATYNVGITTITAGMNLPDFYEALGIAVGDESAKFTTDNSDEALVVTAVENEAVTTTLDSGTSGLVLTQVQAGVSVNPNAGKLLQYKNFVFGNSDVLSCTVYGRTIDGTPTGKLLKYAPEIVRSLLIDAGSEDYLGEASFTSIGTFFNEELAYVIPSKFNDTASKTTYRDVINDINNSVMGILLQSNEFELEYSKLKPSANTAYNFREYDIISFSTESTNKNMIQEAFVTYLPKEYDYDSNSASYLTASATSDQAAYILGTQNTRTYQSFCINEKDASKLAARWTFLLENSSNSFTFQTKLQAIQLSVGDVILVDHRKLYDRVGSEVSRAKLMLVEKIGKTSLGVEITAIDLAGAFSRCAKFTSNSKTYSEADSTERLTGGFFKGTNGIIGSDSNSFWISLFW